MTQHILFILIISVITILILCTQQPIIPYEHFFQDDTNTTSTTPAPAPALIRLDPLDHYKKHQDKTPLYTETHYVLIASKKSIRHHIGCPYNLAGLKVGYTNRSAYNIIQAIVRGHRIDRSKVEMIKIDKSLFQLDTVHLAVITHPKNRIDEILQNPKIHLSGFGDMDIHRVRAFYPFVQGTTTDLRSISPNDVKAKVESSRSTLVMEINPIIVAKSRTREGFDDDDDDDDNYACYGMPEILNKHLCNSPYDHIGNPKKYFSIWDKKCAADTECPYYRVNGDERGGCNKVTGLCEMPVGVKRLGFRKYADKGRFRPFQYGDGDYVFPYDTDDRMAKLKSIVAKK